MIKMNSYTVLLSFNPVYFYYVMLVLCFESDLKGESRVLFLNWAYVFSIKTVCLMLKSLNNFGL